jgi:hypothetical protein
MCGRVSKIILFDDKRKTGLVSSTFWFNDERFGAACAGDRSLKQTTGGILAWPQGAMQMPTPGIAQSHCMRSRGGFKERGMLKTDYCLVLMISAISCLSHADATAARNTEKAV